MLQYRPLSPPPFSSHFFSLLVMVVVKGSTWGSRWCRWWGRGRRKRELGGGDKGLYCNMVCTSRRLYYTSLLRILISLPWFLDRLSIKLSMIWTKVRVGMLSWYSLVAIFFNSVIKCSIDLNSLYNFIVHTHLINIARYYLCLNSCWLFPSLPFCLLSSVTTAWKFWR